MSRTIFSTLVFLVFFVSFIQTTPTGPGFSELGATARLFSNEFCESSVLNFGSGVCILNRERFNSTINCYVQHDLSTITAAALITTSGEPLSFISIDNFGFNFEGVIELQSDEDDSEEADFLSGQWALQLYSTECPLGALVGLLTNEYNVYAKINDKATLPFAQTESRGFLIANYSPVSSFFDIIVQHDVEAAEEITIHYGNRDTVSGAEIYTFDSAAALVNEEVRYLSVREEELYHLQQYINIPSQSFTTGEIRGTLQVLEATPEFNYVFQINSNQQIPANFDTERSDEGIGFFALQCSGFVEYYIQHSVSDIQMAGIYLGDESEEGTLVTELNGVRSPIIGSVQLNNDLKQALIDGRLYVRLSNGDANVDFSIRGQIKPQFPLYGYISGSQEFPPVNTFDKAALVMTFTSANQAVYKIIHNMDTSAVGLESIQFHIGDFGSFAGLQDITTTVSSPVVGSLEITDDQRRDITQQLWYVNFITTDLSSGYIRGQLLRRVESQCISYEIEDYIEEGDLLDTSDNYYESTFFFGGQSSDACFLLPSLFVVYLFSLFILF